MKKVLLALTTASAMLLSSVTFSSESQTDFAEQARERHGLEKSVKMLDLNFYTGRATMKSEYEPTMYEKRQARLELLEELREM
ncbi:hypothetical protein [Endozoicomonas ascidiicola]|uniref:hypothetical protein n=1 Tax=Endozoicomonas ascidiicola TaxID=1698521 RepID=UPI000832028B|nr:hypothetical protein [Endozoicomonas ascidiicola]